MSAARFVADMRRIVAKAKGNIDLVCRKVVLDLHGSLVMKSPVGDPSTWKSKPPEGYVGGQFRANWQVQINGIPKGTLPDIDGSGSATLQKGAAVIMQGRGGDTWFLINNLPYARRLEYDGWSRQAPAGMVGPTVTEFRQWVTKAAGEVQ